MENKRTINCKTFDECMILLKKPFNYLVEDFAGHPCLSEHQVRERLDNVFGLNYSFVLTKQPNIETIDNIRYTISCTAYLEVRDDNGNFICRRSQAGGTDVVIPSQKTSPMDLSNDDKKAVTDCFKKCAKLFGVRASLLAGGKVYHRGEVFPEENEDAADPIPPVNKDDNISTKETPIGEVKVFQLKSAAITDNKKVKFEVVDGEGNAGVLVIWNNKKGKLSPDISKKLATFAPGMRLEVDFKEAPEFKGKRQFVVENILKCTA